MWILKMKSVGWSLLFSWVHCRFLVVFLFFMTLLFSFLLLSLSPVFLLFSQNYKLILCWTTCLCVLSHVSLCVCVRRELSGSFLCTWDASLYCSYWQISGYKNKPTEIALIVLFLYCTNVSRDVRSCSWRWTGLYIHQNTELDPSMMILMYCKLMHCSVRIICSSGFQRWDVGTRLPTSRRLLWQQSHKCKRNTRVLKLIRLQIESAAGEHHAGY